MRLKNKKTGEICDFKIIADYDDCTSGWRLEKHDGTVLFYDHIDEIHSEWEDVPEEPKEWWYIDIHGPHNVIKNDEYYQVVKEASKQIGNYFETKEEAEKAVEKLKAFKRLKDKGFRFKGWFDSASDDHPDNIMFVLDKNAWTTNICDDLDLLFGGEE